MLSRFDVNGTPGSVTINSWSASTGTISVESDLIVYTVEAYNGGPADATNLTVRDDFPTDIISMSDTSGGAYDPATGLWSIPTLANGSTATYHRNRRCRDGGYHDHEHRRRHRFGSERPETGQQRGTGNGHGRSTGEPPTDARGPGW